MDYKRHYNLLIERARNRKLEGYSEGHHIIPKCLGGLDTKDNIVRLTPEEHYIAHQLLIKIYPENDSLIYAAVMMIPNRPSNKLYGWIKRKYAFVCSQRVGKLNGSYKKVWFHNPQTHDVIKCEESKVPEGYVRGRVIKEKRICASCGQLFLEKTNKKKICCSRSCTMKKWKEDPQNRKGTPHSEETKRKLSNISKDYLKSNSHSQTGTMWITNEKENKKIKKVDNIPEGWYKGRVIKT